MAIIGIDLGTSNSAAAVLRGGRPVIIPSAEGISIGGKAFPSYVAVTADGSIASFLIWWPDAMSGIAQLEPVGTHPAYQGRGLATAVFARALADMRAAGMHTVRGATPSSWDRSSRSASRRSGCSLPPPT